MGVGVRTTSLAFTQLGSVTEGFKQCWRTGQKLTFVVALEVAANA